MLFVGGSRAHHYQELFDELGITTLCAGYEFGHRDDYEGRRVIPSSASSSPDIKVSTLPRKEIGCL